MKFNYWIGLMLLLGIFACQDDDMTLEDEMMVVNDTIPVEPQYAEGIYVTNEGPFQSGTGTLSYFNRTERTVENDIYQTENNGAVLGNIVQSMTFDGDNAYIVVNNANKVVQVDAESMQYVQDIEGLALPRYVQVAGDKLYISQWGATGVDGSVEVYNTSSNSMEASIPTKSGAERMLLADNKLYVTNAGGFSRDSIVSVIDITTNEVVTELVVGDNPNSIQQDTNGSIWVLCKGYTDWDDASNNTSGKLVKIENDEVVLSIDVANSADDLVIDSAGEMLYFTTATAVNRHAITDTQLASDAAFIDRSFYSLAVDTDGTIIAGDAKDFVSNGEVVLYSSEGEELESFEVGIIPGHIAVK